LLKAIKNVNLSSNMVFLIPLLSMYYGFVFNYPIIDKIYILSDNQGVFYFLSPIILTFSFIIVFSLHALPYLFKAIQIPLLLTSALAFYASLKSYTAVQCPELPFNSHLRLKDLGGDG